MLIKRTKLIRPTIPEEFIPRPRLMKRFEKLPLRPLTLVSAPAGYGKSSLVSSWMDRCDCPSTWISLDTHDNDIRLFLSYFIASLQTIFPDIGSTITHQIHSPYLPPTEELVSCLINELEGIDQEFIMVMDDFHLIQDKSVCAFLREYLRHPDQNLHLILVSRKDPFLPISSLRGLDLVTEVRTRDLRFTDVEVKMFLERTLNDQVDDATASALAKKTEGWVTGLRLIVLAFRDNKGFCRDLSAFTGTHTYVMDYLVAEVLANQSQAIRYFLLSMSIVERFCSSLCRALCGPDENSGLEEMTGDRFIETLQKNSVFLTALDHENQWFRFHHLFKDLLLRQAELQFGSEEIAALHCRASKWFERHGFIDDAIDHALAAGDSLAVALIIERNRHAALDADRWNELQGWLNKISPEIKQKRPELLLCQAWIYLFSAQMSRISHIAECVESLLDTDPEAPPLLAEIYFFRGLVCYFKGEAALSVAHFHKSTELLSGTCCVFLKSQAEYWTCVALHLEGQKENALERLHDGLYGKDLENMMLSRLRFGLCYIHMLESDFLRAFHEGLSLTSCYLSDHVNFTDTWGWYIQGNASLQMFELDAAQEYFAQVAGSRYMANPRVAVDAMTGAAVCSCFMGYQDKTDDMMRLARDYVQEINNPELSEIISSCQARVKLLQGDFDSASRWQRSVNKGPGIPVTLFFMENPAITECRILLASGSEASLTKTIERLEELRQNAKAWQNTFQMIEIMVLLASAMHYQGRVEKAIEILGQAVAMAMPGEFIRPFVESGLPMVDLLEQLAEKKVAVHFIERIVNKIKGNEPGPSKISCTQPRQSDDSPVSRSIPLTNRELDVLELLAQRFRNKEIAEKLIISTETVRTHLQNIYTKMDASNRRQAVSIARDIGILSPVSMRF